MTVITKMTVIAYYNEEVGVSASEDGYIHGYSDRVRFVEADTKVPLSTQQQQDKHTDVHQTNTSWKTVRKFNQNTIFPIKRA